MMVVYKKNRKPPVKAPCFQPYQFSAQAYPAPPAEENNPIHEAVIKLGSRLELRRSHSGESLIYFLDGRPVSVVAMLEAAGFKLRERRK